MVILLKVIHLKLLQGKTHNKSFKKDAKKHRAF